ncbi:flagellar basal-body MS-ring/collar protein FliF [Brevundimonas aveniformis]|uniref:flagellar basal-body MS-ring/collar protein FliF n=1 Tax=Brevundimonas aveniformis TaxID=370977 RepID=UPI000428F731|nr:flagellar basal-body MS-ring/collar protein FliF [Brevundimonas aveniformis]
MGGFTAAIQRFGIGRLAALAGVAAGVAAVLVALMLRVGESPSALLYSNLDLREAGEVTAALDQAGISYEARGDGSTILVNRDDVGTARLMLAEQGLVTSGSVGYELFDAQSALGQTEFQQNMNRKRAIEGEIARTLMSMRGVNRARVMIALPERQLFQAEAAPVTASVSIDTGGREMTGEEIQAVQQLVSTAVTGLRPDRVTIVDANNRLLAAGGEGEGFSGAAASERRTEIEHRLQATLLNLVEGVVGPGAARVQVTAEIDETRQTIQAQEFNPDGQVVRSTSSQQSNSSDSQGAEGGIVGVEEQLPEGEGAQGTAQGPSSTSDETGETTNYEISNTVTTTVREPGTIQRLSVAVAVDGVVTPPAGGEGEATYAPRSEEDMQRIQQLVRSAMGFNEGRGDQVEVVNVRFARPDGAAIGGTEASSGMFNFDQNDIMQMIQWLVLLIVGVLMVFFVLRPLVKAASTGGGVPMIAGSSGGEGGGGQALGGGTMSGAPALPPSEMDQRLDIARIEGQVKASSVRKVSEFVDSHPDESTAILRSWVHEG